MKTKAFPLIGTKCHDHEDSTETKLLNVYVDLHQVKAFGTTGL